MESNPGVPQIAETELPYDTAILVLALPPEEFKTQLQRERPMVLFIAELFPISQRGMQPKGPGGG